MRNQEAMNKVLRAGVMLSSERDMNRLLDTILSSVMELANCDAGTLYLLDGDALHFKIMHTNSMNTHLGGDGKAPGLPPVPLRRENVCAFALLEGRTVCIEDVYTSAEYDFSGPIRYDAMTGYHTRSMLVVPMHSREGEKLGVLQLINAMNEEGRVCPFAPETVLVLESLASQAAVTIQNVRYLETIQELFRSFVRAISAAIDKRSPYNVSHSRRMALFAGRFVEFLNRRALEKGEEPPFSAQHRDELVMSILLHDIGKVTTPLEVMNKPERLYEPQKAAIRSRMAAIRLGARIGRLEGRLTDEERAALEQDTRRTEEELLAMSKAGFLADGRLAWLDEVRQRRYTDEDGVQRPWLTDEEYAMLSIRRGTLSGRERDIMESHVTDTDLLLSKLRFTAELSHVRPWAAAHHELLNGSGYPNHLAGDAIPREVRIITILDIFDALVADDRPYKPGMPVNRALSILGEMAQKEEKLDPELTALFIESRCWEGIPLTGELPDEETPA